MPKVSIEEIRILIENSLTSYWETVKNQLVGENSEVAKLKQENKELKEELSSVKEQLEHQGEHAISGGGNLPVNLERFEAIEQELKALKDLISHLKSEPEEVHYDLRKEFDKKILFDTSDTELDWESKLITAEILAEVFSKTLAAQKKKLPTGYDYYKFSARAIDTVLSIKEWIIPGATKQVDISKFKLESATINNAFIPWDPQEKRVSLGTGTGKSTFFLRCLAHRHPETTKGATLVVPYSSLVGSVLGAHNKWLSQGKDTMKDELGNTVDDPLKRVTVCPICDQRHTAELDEKGKPINAYETVHNGASNMINVYTWWEFLDAYLNRPEEIKPWVVFDEAHTDLPAYQALIQGLKKLKSRPFKIVEMSATFGDMPTSKKLTGNISDYYVTDWDKFLKKAQPNFFKKKVIVFCDDFKELNFKVLDENKIKYIKLDDSLKEYATDIVRATSSPCLIFANRDYSVGFSFGDVNVISTGISRRTIIIDDKGSEKPVSGTSDFADLLQERGRGARDVKHTAVWVSLVPENGKYILKDDYFGITLENYFKKADDKLKSQLLSIIKLASKIKPVAELPERDARLNLYKLLTTDLKEHLNDPDKKLFTVLPSELKVDKEEDKQYTRSYGEYIFRNPLVKYFQEEDLKDLLIITTRDKIEEFAKLGNYEWYKTPEEEDDYIFNNLEDLKPFGFYFQVRANCIIVKDKTHPKHKNKELRLKFTPYKLDGKKKLLAVSL